MTAKVQPRKSMYLHENDGENATTKFHVLAMKMTAKCAENNEMAATVHVPARK